MQTYSFLDVNVTIAGPGGNFSLGNGAGPAEEGITITMTEDKNTMVIGADGSSMHSLHAGNSGSLSVTLLKTSPVNALLMAMYNLQRQAGSTWGKNVLVVTDFSRGDVISARQVAFTKVPELKYAKDGGTNEWTFQAGAIDDLLGIGQAA